MKLSSAFILKTALVVILFMHSVPGMIDGGVTNFGKFYLNEIGFAPFGVPLAWAIKLSHVVAIAAILLNRYVKLMASLTISILIMGIVMVHSPEGWYVVGGGRNGMEFNFLLIAALLAIMFPDGLNAKKS